MDMYSKNKTLPISMPLSSTYMIPAAEFSVLQSYENGMNYILNRYTQLFLFENAVTSGSTDLGLSMQTDSFDHNPCFRTCKIDKAFDYIIKDIIEFIIDSIDHGKYVYIYRYIDEYYIKDMSAYNKFHLIHMFVLYGYDLGKKLFYTLGYNKRGVFANIEICFDEFLDSIQGIDNTGDHYLILVDPNSDYTEIFDRNRTRFWIEQYLQSKNSRIMMRGVMDDVAMTDQLVFGYKIYSYMDLYYHFFENGDIDINLMDRRSLRQLWEHKKIMMKRIEKMSDSGFVSSEYKGKYKSVLDASTNLHNMQTKLNFTGDISILRRIRERLNILAENEFHILSELTEEL